MASKKQTENKKKYCSQGFLTNYWGSRGGYGSIPGEVIDGPDWCSLSLAASKVLFILVRQYKGSNNGDLCATESVMSKYGISSPNTINRSLKELLAKGLIAKTQHGYRGNDGKRRLSLYALTWLSVDSIEDKQAGEWIPKIKGTHSPLRMTFNTPYEGSIQYEPA